MGRSMARSRLVAFVVSNLLLPISVFVFALAFFPYKPLLPGLAVYDATVIPAALAAETPAASFDRVIFMVVDALRSDFVFGFESGFSFTQELIRNGSAYPFTAFAAPPTVTMPRIKALTTGSVPSFADLIFNLDESDTGSSLAGQDTWLAQIKARGQKLIFYGDDTWLRLFPGDFFARAEGTSSFFVSVSRTDPGMAPMIASIAENQFDNQDFTEVDHNVTRHLPVELARSDWDAMIVHYLGLDHIGHKTGPQGPNMLPKQREMDAIVQQIYDSMLTQTHQQRTLLVLAGDHGMNAGGNHGGSGPGETEPALVFISPQFQKSSTRHSYDCPTAPKAGTEFHYYRKIQQSDLVPTLASLLRFPVPKNSLGVLIQEVVGLGQSKAALTRSLYENAQQIQKVVAAKLGEENFLVQIEVERERLARGNKDETDGEKNIASLWLAAEQELRSGDTLDYDAANRALTQFLVAAQDYLSNVASLYNLPQMIIGITLALIATGLATTSLFGSTTWSLEAVYLTLTCLLYGTMMFASSYVEEEQHFWYWLTPCWITLLTIQAIATTHTTRASRRLAIFAATAILAIHRLAVRWNQTGQKHAGEPDIVHGVFPNHHIFMWVLILATYSYFGFQVSWTSLTDLVTREIGAMVAVALIVAAIGFKLNFTQADAPELVQDLAQQLRDWSQDIDLVRQAQLFFLLLGLLTLAVVVLSIVLAMSTVISSSDAPAIRTTLPERLHYLVTLFLITQTRAPNIPLFLGFEIQRRALRVLLIPRSGETQSKTQSLRDASISPIALAVSVLLFSHVEFFSMGGSNSISSIDLSNAYNGVGDYNMVAVGVLLFSSNWTGPIWWCSAAVLMTFAKPLDHGTIGTEEQRAWIQQERIKLRQDASNEKSQASLISSSPWVTYVSALTAFVGTSLLAIMVTCTVLRTHLFIWTVFSPKYLYAMAWCFGWHILVNICVGGLLRALGKIA